MPFIDKQSAKDAPTLKSPFVEAWNECIMLHTGQIIIDLLPFASYCRRIFPGRSFLRGLSLANELENVLHLHAACREDVVATVNEKRKYHAEKLLLLTAQLCTTLRPDHQLHFPCITKE